MCTVLLTYTHEGKTFRFIYDLHNADHQDRMLRTLVWAANQKIIVRIHSTQVAEVEAA